MERDVLRMNEEELDAELERQLAQLDSDDEGEGSLDLARVQVQALDVQLHQLREGDFVREAAPERAAQALAPPEQAQSGLASSTAFQALLRSIQVNNERLDEFAEQVRELQSLNLPDEVHARVAELPAHLPHAPGHGAATLDPSPPATNAATMLASAPRVAATRAPDRDRERDERVLMGAEDALAEALRREAVAARIAWEAELAAERLAQAHMRRQAELHGRLMEEEERRQRQEEAFQRAQLEIELEFQRLQQQAQRAAAEAAREVAVAVEEWEQWQMRRAAAATRIQARARGRLARRAAAQLRSQAVLLRTTRAATQIQHSWRQVAARRNGRALRQRMRLEHAALVVQCAVRGWLARRSAARVRELQAQRAREELLRREREARERAMAQQRRRAALERERRVMAAEDAAALACEQNERQQLMQARERQQRHAVAVAAAVQRLRVLAGEQRGLLAASRCATGGPPDCAGQGVWSSLLPAARLGGERSPAVAYHRRACQQWAQFVAAASAARDSVAGTPSPAPQPDAVASTCAACAGSHRADALLRELGRAAPRSQWNEVGRLSLHRQGLACLHGVESARGLLALDASHNALGSLHALRSCPRLRELTLRECSLRTLGYVEQLAELMELRADGNQLVDVAALAGCPRLHSAHFAHNRLDALAVLPLAHCPRLAVLNCAHNKLVVIPPVVAQLRWLQRVDLSRNEIADVPDAAFADCPLLQHLVLFGNRIQRFPLRLACPLLHELWLNGNPIRALPTCADGTPAAPAPSPVSLLPLPGWLPSLQVLYLQNCALTSLAPLHQCPALRVLDLSYNQIPDLRELAHLRESHNLHRLALAGNPCAPPAGRDLSAYRVSVLGALPSVSVLDDEAVTEQEHVAACNEYLCGRALVLMPSIARARQQNLRHSMPLRPTFHTTHAHGVLAWHAAWHAAHHAGREDTEARAEWHATTTHVMVQRQRWLQANLAKAARQAERPSGVLALDVLAGLESKRQMAEKQRNLLRAHLAEHRAFLAPMAPPGEHRYQRRLEVNRAYLREEQRAAQAQAAATIQRCWRTHFQRCVAAALRQRPARAGVVYRRTVSALRELCLPEIRESCATAIQAHWRGHCARQVVRPVLRKRAARRLRAAMLVQRVFRGFRVRIRLQRVRMQGADEDEFDYAGVDLDSFLGKVAAAEAAASADWDLPPPPPAAAGHTSGAFAGALVAALTSGPPAWRGGPAPALWSHVAGPLAGTPPAQDRWASAVPAPMAGQRVAAPVNEGDLETESVDRESLASRRGAAASWANSKAAQETAAEWGISDERTAQLLHQRNARHLRLQHAQQQRDKMADPNERLREFARRAAASGAPLPPAVAAAVSKGAAAGKPPPAPPRGSTSLVQRDRAAHRPTGKKRVPAWALGKVAGELTDSSAAEVVDVAVAAPPRGERPPHVPRPPLDQTTDTSRRTWLPPLSPRRCVPERSAVPLRVHSPLLSDSGLASPAPGRPRGPKSNSR